MDVKYRPARKFRHFMTDNSITYKQVSIITGYRPETISTWVKGTKDFPYTAMCRLCEYYKKSLDELFGE